MSKSLNEVVITVLKMLRKIVSVIIFKISSDILKSKFLSSIICVLRFAMR